MIARLAPCLLLLAASPAAAQVCERARLDLPEPIADAVRPYVVCGLFSGEDGVLFKLTGGESASVPRPLGRAVCGTVRANAALEADQGLQATMPDRAARERYIESVLQDADRFIDAAYVANRIAIDPAEQTPACGSAETRTSNASDH